MRFDDLFIVWYAIILHFVWGCLLLASDAPLNITAISFITKLGLVNSANVGVIYLIVAFLGLIGMLDQRLPRLLLLLPQQIVLVISAMGALWAMCTGQFADGVVRPRSFLIADQLPAVLAATLNIWAVYSLYWKEGIQYKFDKSEWT